LFGITSLRLSGLVGLLLVAPAILFSASSKIGAQASVVEGAVSTSAPSSVDELSLSVQAPGGPILVPAGESALDQFESPRGQIPEGPGIYFLDVASGGVEGWREKHFRDYQSWKPEFAWHRLAISGDNRFVAVPRTTAGGILVDRQTGLTYRWRSGVEAITSADGQLAAGGGRVLFRAVAGLQKGQLHVVDLSGGPSEAATFSGIDPVDHGLLSPDGRLALIVGDAAQILDVEQGSARLVQLDPSVRPVSGPAPGRRVPGPSAQNTLDGSAFLLLSTPGSGAIPGAGWAHYSWTGDLIRSGTANVFGFPATLHPSPSGSVLAWVESQDTGNPAGATIVRAVDTITGDSLFSVPGANTCHESTAGNRWLADESGLVVRTESGFKLAMRDGQLRALVGKQLIASPDDAAEFADGVSVVDRDGNLIAAAQPPEWVRPWFSSWGDAGSELRIATLMVGRGGECAGLDFRERPAPIVDGPSGPDGPRVRSGADDFGIESLPDIDVYVDNPGDCTSQTTGDHSYSGSWGYARDLGGCTTSNWKFYVDPYGLGESHITSWVYATESSGSLYQRSGGSCTGPVTGQYGITLQIIQQQGEEYRDVGFYRLLHMSSVDSQGTYEENGYVIGQPDNRTWLYYSNAGNCQGEDYLYSSANHVHWWKLAGAQFSSWWSSPALYILFYN
jgi:hypothetical protein